MKRIVFVQDNFSDQFQGGAELSIQTHINSCPYPSVKLVRSKEFNPKNFNPKKDFLVFGNFFEVKREFLPIVIDKFQYVIEECDYKYCRYRSSHKHKAFELKDCDCHDNAYGQQIFRLFMAAKWMFWKSARQRHEYIRLFGNPVGDWPVTFLGTIVGGVFSDADLDFILSLRGTARDEKYFVLRSDSWIKGHTAALDYCRSKKIPYREVSGLGYRDSLREMARSKGIVYFPRGFDVSCRMITEARLLGIDIITDEALVQHTTEDWFKGADEGRIAFLRSRDKEFWGVLGGLIK